jgi:hypothetical protein
VYLPVGDVREMVERMMGSGVMSGSQESFDKEWDALIENAIGDDKVEDRIDCAEHEMLMFNQDEVDVTALLGEDWNGDVVVIEDDKGDEYLLYRGQWKNPFVVSTEGYGWMKLNGDAEEGVGVLNIDFDADTQSSLFDLKSDNAHFVWRRSVDDTLQDRLNNLDFASQLASRIRVMHIEVNAFIAADVLEFPGHWKGDGRNFGEEGSSRSSQTLKLLFKDGEWSILEALQLTGITHRLNKEGYVIESGQADGRTLTYALKKVVSDIYNREVYCLHLTGNEGNPLRLFPALPLDSPGITYDINFYFDDKGHVLRSVIEHDKYPSHEVIMDGEIIYQFDEKEGSIFELLSTPILFKPMRVNILLEENENAL